MPVYEVMIERTTRATMSVEADDEEDARMKVLSSTEYIVDAEWKLVGMRILRGPRRLTRMMPID